ncbi:MAG: helix-turn-helix domain-containing protein [Candidatus Cryptobacteroides sp.]
MINLSFPAMCEPASLLTVLSTLLLASTCLIRHRPSGKKPLRIPLLPAISLILSLITAVADEAMGLDAKVACDIVLAVPPLAILPRSLTPVQTAALILSETVSAGGSIFACIGGQARNATSLCSLTSLLSVLLFLITETRRTVKNSENQTTRLSISGVLSSTLYMLFSFGITCFSLTTPLLEDLRPVFDVSLTTASCSLLSLALVRHSTSRPFVVLDRIEKQVTDSYCRQIRDRTLSYENKNIMLSAIFNRIQRYFDDKLPFLDDSFTITALSEHIFTNRLYVSKAIGEYSGMNFCQFVNTYRVRYSIECMKRNPRLKVSELASMSGFRTQSSFNQAFRKYTGETPSDWVRRNFRKAGGSPGTVLQN